VTPGQDLGDILLAIIRTAVLTSGDLPKGIRMKRTLVLILAGALVALSPVHAATAKSGNPKTGAPKIGAPKDGKPKGTTVAVGVQWLGGMADNRIDESSGVAVSRRDPNVFWTHNDGGAGKRPRIFSIDRTGKSLGAFSIGGTNLHDWEDIATDAAGNLYLGDIGNSEAKRTTLAVYQFPEPDPRASGGAAGVQRAWQLRFPGAPFDCESLFVWKDHGYLVSKVAPGTHAQIFRFPLKDTTEPVTLELVVSTKIDSPVTGADISPDGKLLGLVANNGAYVYRIDGDIARVAKAKPHHTKYKDAKIEGCSFVADGLICTSETGAIYLFTDPQFRGK
jgi:hypothetical protein